MKTKDLSIRTEFYFQDKKEISILVLGSQGWRCDDKMGRRGLIWQLPVRVAVALCSECTRGCCGGQACALFEHCVIITCTMGV